MTMAAVAVGDGHGGVAGVVLAAEAADRGIEERAARDDGDAVIALLAVDQPMCA